MKLTTEAAPKPVPLTVRVRSALPATAVAGVRPLMVGTGLGTSTVKLVALVAVPPGVVMARAPEVAPAGTSSVSVVLITNVNILNAPPMSVTAVAPVKLLPVTVTTVPGRPLPGVKLLMVGAGTVTVKVAAVEVPPPGAGLVTVTL